VVNVTSVSSGNIKARTGADMTGAPLGTERF
jgi:hypothetical protein